MSALSLFALGLLLGFSLAVPPGPMNALIAARAGIAWRSGAWTGLGALSADAILGVLVFAFQSVVDLTAYIRWVYLLGSGVMLLLVYLLVRPPGRANAPVPSSQMAYSQGLLTGLSNPFQILWWLTAGTGFAYVGGLPLFAGLFGAILLWIAFFPWVVRTGTERYPAIEPWVRYSSAALMTGFAAYFLFLAVAGGP